MAKQNEIERDVLADRARIGVVAPATNTIVQPELEAMRPAGVTNHHGRIQVSNVPMASDADFLHVLDLLDQDMDRALDDVAECAPDHLIVGVTSPMLRGGVEACTARLDSIEARTGIPATAGSSATARVLKNLAVKRIGLVTPYQPVMDGMLRAYLAEGSVEIVELVALRCPSPFAIAQVPASVLRYKITTADRPEIDAWVQVGTNLGFSNLAPELTEDLGKPVFGVNAATYWEALRRIGVTEPNPASGPVLSELAF